MTEIKIDIEAIDMQVSITEFFKNVRENNLKGNEFLTVKGNKVFLHNSEIVQFHAKYEGEDIIINSENFKEKPTEKKLNINLSDINSCKTIDDYRKKIAKLEQEVCIRLKLEGVTKKSDFNVGKKILRLSLKHFIKSNIKCEDKGQGYTKIMNLLNKVNFYEMSLKDQLTTLNMVLDVTNL